MNKLFRVLILVLLVLSWTSCHKELDVKDPVVSNDEMTVSGAQAHFSWCVDFGGQFQTGVELSPNENMTDLRRVEAKKEGDKYVAVVDGLSMGTKYYYRIIVWNKLNNYEQEMRSFATSPTFTITLACNPEEGGTTIGGGTYIVGDSCTMIATANTGYDFVNWMENGNQVSTDSVCTFAVTYDRTLVANFSLKEFEITLMATPENGGIVSGSGIYMYGQNCTVTAVTNAGYIFVNWTENGIQVSTMAEYSFEVTDNRQIVANFKTAPTGAINGLFRINANGDQVYFSKGNLQFQASTNIWRFAENQWNYVGGTSYSEEFGNVYENGVKCGNNEISSTYTGWIDLFGWGTSGCENGNLYYRPYDYEYLEYPGGDYGYGYGPTDGTNYLNSLTGTYANADWGIYNPISNGGNQSGQWRTLTHEEWIYIFNKRETYSGFRFAKAQVNNVNGVILLPDDWNSSYYSLSNINMNVLDFDGNNISASQWGVLEQHGAVFLPCAGSRYQTSVNGTAPNPTSGIYWSSSCNDNYSAYSAVFSNTGGVYPNSHSIRYDGLSVRLVYPYR